MKKQILCLLTVASASLLALPAGAQMYPGEDVVVNPAAIPNSPVFGQGYAIHRPHHHHHAAKKIETAATDSVAATPAEMTTTSSPAPSDAMSAPAPDAAPTPPPAKPRHSKHTTTAAAATPAAEPASGGMGFSFGDDEPPAPPPANTKTASNEPAPQQAAKPAKPDTKADASTAGLAKRGAILFEHNSTDPQPSQMDGIKLLAGDLNSALEAGATQIQLMAFGGAAGDKGSDAKRISLKRALAIRQLLIDNGVPSNKIITKAMGGATDNGEPDRVDIYVRA